MRGVTLRQLRAFAVVARGRSFARAAVELRLSPSAVSLQIKELEAAVRLPLFDRADRTVSLTPAGQVLLAEAERILAALERAGAALRQLREGHADRVAVGMVGNAQYFMPRLLARFHERYRGVALSLAIGSREWLLDRLGCGDVDLAIIGTPPDGFAGRADLFATQPLGIVAPPGHVLASQRQIEPSALAGHDFIVRERGSGTRSAMERFFGAAQIEPPRVMEMSSNESIKQAVAANLGLAFLSLHTAALELQARLLVALDVVGLPVLRPWYVVSRPQGTAAEPVNSLRHFILEAGHSAANQPFGLGADGANPVGQADAACSAAAP